MDDGMQTMRHEEYGRLYKATTEEIVHDATVIRGTLLIHLVPTVILFDLGSTHTFLARTFVDRIGLTVGDLQHNLVVLTPSGVNLTTKVV